MPSSTSKQAVLRADYALCAAALTREQAQGNIRRGNRILVCGFDVLILKQHARQAAGWARSWKVLVSATRPFRPKSGSSLC